MYTDTVEFVKNCLNCQQAKIGHSNKPEQGRTYVPYLPMDTLAIDILAVGRQGSHNYKYILSVIDYVSRFAWAIPVKSRTATEIANALIKHVFMIFGNPAYLVSDRAAEFTSKEFQDILKELEIKNHQIVTYNPTGNSVVERLNRSILQMLRSLLLDFDENWNELLPAAMSFYNAAYHETVKNSPHFLMFLQDARIPYETILAPTHLDDPTLEARAKQKAQVLELAKNAIITSQRDPQETNMQKKRQIRIDIGDMVFLRNVSVSRKDHKILKKIWGPHRVLDLTPTTAIIKCIKNGRMRHVSLKNIKLLHYSAVSKTENRNVDSVFPIEDENADIPSDLEFEEVTRHKSLGKMGNSDPGKRLKVTGESREKPPSKGLNKDKLKFVQNMSEPIASRTRNRVKAYEASIK